MNKKWLALALPAALALGPVVAADATSGPPGPIPAADGTITGCYYKNFTYVRVVDADIRARRTRSC